MEIPKITEIWWLTKEAYKELHRALGLLCIARNRTVHLFGGIEDIDSRPESKGHISAQIMQFHSQTSSAAVVQHKSTVSQVLW